VPSNKQNDLLAEVGKASIMLVEQVVLTFDAARKNPSLFVMQAITNLC
jgi:hypothetical protein